MRLLISFAVFAVCFGLFGCTNAFTWSSGNSGNKVTSMRPPLSKKQNEPTGSLSIVSARDILIYSANDEKSSQFPIEDNSKSFKNYSVVKEITSNCANNSIYVLKQEFSFQRFINKKILDVIHYDENNKFTRIYQVDNIFNKAISISSDRKSPGNIYWIENNDNTYSIKVIDESFDTTQQKYIINPTDKIKMQKLQVYNDKIFFSSNNALWYASNSPNSNATSLFPSSKNFKQILDINIDYATDKLYWSEFHKGRTTLYSVDIGTSDLPLNEDKINPEITKVELGLHFFVFNNRVYTTIGIRQMYNEDLYRMNGNKEPTMLRQIDSRQNMPFIFSRCPSGAAQNKSNSPISLTTTTSQKKNQNQQPELSDNQNNSTNVLLLVTDSKIFKSQYSTKDVNLSKFEIENRVERFEPTEIMTDLTSTCEDKNIYILKSTSLFREFEDKKMLDVIHYGENNKFKRIRQIENMFDNAISIASDYMGKIYWIDDVNGEFSIKVTNESFNKSEYIIHPTSEIHMEKLIAHPKRSEIFFSSYDGHLWYTSNSTNSTANLLFSPNAHFQKILDLTIDYLTDKLCWIAYVNDESHFYCADISALNRPLNPNRIVPIARLSKRINNFVVLNNTYYWTASKNLKKLYFKNGNSADPVKETDLQEEGLLSIVPSICPSKAA